MMTTEAYDSFTCAFPSCINDTSLMTTNDSVSNQTMTGDSYYGWMYQHDRLKYSVEGVATTCIGVFGVVGNIFTLMTLARQVPPMAADRRGGGGEGGWVGGHFRSWIGPLRLGGARFETGFAGLIDFS